MKGIKKVGGQSPVIWETTEKGKRGRFIWGMTEK